MCDLVNNISLGQVGAGALYVAWCAWCGLMTVAFIKNAGRW